MIVNRGRRGIGPLQPESMQPGWLVRRYARVGRRGPGDSDVSTQVLVPWVLRSGQVNKAEGNRERIRGAPQSLVIRAEGFNSLLYSNPSLWMDQVDEARQGLFWPLRPETSINLPASEAPHMTQLSNSMCVRICLVVYFVPRSISLRSDGEDVYKPCPLDQVHRTRCTITIDFSNAVSAAV